MTECVGGGGGATSRWTRGVRMNRLLSPRYGGRIVSGFRARVRVLTRRESVTTTAGSVAIGTGRQLSDDGNDLSAGGGGGVTWGPLGLGHLQQSVRFSSKETTVVDVCAYCVSIARCSGGRNRRRRRVVRRVCVRAFHRVFRNCRAARSTVSRNILLMSCFTWPCYRFYIFTFVRFGF